MVLFVILNNREKHSKKIKMKKLLLNIWSALLKIYDRFTSREIEVSIGDIILSQPHPDFILFLAASRHLDAMHYCSGEDRSFKYMHGISSKWHGKKYSPEKGEKKFKDLIESFRKKGYDPSSLLVMDKDLNLDNGTHRLALCLLSGVYNVKVLVIRRKAIVYRTVDWYYNAGLESGLLEEISNEYERIYNMLIDDGHAFRCRIEGNVKTIAEDIKKDLYVLCGYTHISILQESENSIEYSFSILNPCYTIDNKEKQLLSKRSVEIEGIMKNRYENRGVAISLSKNCIRK